MVEYRWQLPYSGEAEVKIDVGMPPHTAASRVIAPASRDMKPRSQASTAPVDERRPGPARARDGEAGLEERAGSSEHRGLGDQGPPTEGPGKIIATLLSGAGSFGLVLGTKKPNKADKTERARACSPRSRSSSAPSFSGDVGPKTYERARRELPDALNSNVRR